MKALKKMVIVLLLTLVAASAVSLLTEPVKATVSLNCQVSISSGSSSVTQETSYAFDVRNTGTATVGSANITVPSGYINIGNLAVSQPTGQGWTATLQTIKTSSKTSYFILLYGSTQGFSPNQTVKITFNARNPQTEGSYKWIIGVNENATTTGLNVPQTVTVNTPYSIVIGSISDATLILIIAFVIAFVNTALNRVLINYFVGWEQYRVMQKEMNEYRQETMAAARANDKKQMERLKKRQSQITNMQTKMLKPQMVQLAISFVYIFIWIFVLIPTYGITSMVYLPGFGALPVVYWYPIASFFLGLLASRLLGIMPIEP